MVVLNVNSMIRISYEKPENNFNRDSLCFDIYIKIIYFTNDITMVDLIFTVNNDLLFTNA